MTDEILIKLGINTTAVHAGLKSLHRFVENWADKIKESFSEAFKHLAAPLSVAGIIGISEKVLKSVERIKASSEALGVSPKFLQDIENVGRASGIAGEKVGSMLEKFVKGLKPGSDVETEFLKIADALEETKDPVTRAQIAFDAVGKSFGDFLKITAGGSSGIKALAGEFKTFSDVQIAALENANHHIEQTENTLTLWAGTAIAWGARVAQTFGAIFGNMGKYVRGGIAHFGEAWRDVGARGISEAAAQEAARKTAQAMAGQAKRIAEANAAYQKFNQHLEDLRLRAGTASEKLAILTQRLKEQVDAARKSGSTAEQLDHIGKIADLEAEISKVKEEERRRQDEANKRQLDALNKQVEAQHKLAEANQSITDAISERSKVGLDDLLSSGDAKFARYREWRRHQAGLAGGDAGLTGFESTAQIIRDLESQARDARLNGNGSFADDLTKRAISMRNSLGGVMKEGDANPLRGIYVEQKRAADALSKLQEMAEFSGIAIHGTD